MICLLYHAPMLRVHNKAQTHILHQIKFTSTDVKLSINYVAVWVKGAKR